MKAKEELAQKLVRNQDANNVNPDVCMNKNV